MTLDPRSLKHLQGVRPELANVINEAATRTKFRVTEGLRSKERQAQLVKARKSKTMNSRHITGHAIDFIAIGDDGVATYDADDMRRVADVIKEVAADHRVKIEWGGDWLEDPHDEIGWDSPHVELDRKAYPANAVSTTRRVIEAVRDHPKTTLTTVAVGSQAVEEAAPVVPALPSIPAPPDLSSYAAWRGFGQQAADLVGFATANLMVTTACAGYVGCVWFWPRIKAAAGNLFSKWRAA